MRAGAARRRGRPSAGLAALLPAALLLGAAACSADPRAPESGEPSWAAEEPAPEVLPEVAELAFEALELPGVRDATDFVFLPPRGDALELLVTSLGGSVHHLRLGAAGAAHLGSASLPVYLDEGCGLHSLTLDPAFAERPYVYLTRCVDTRTSTLTRHRFEPGSVLAPGEREVLTVSTPSDPPEDWHRFGSLGFEPDGVTLWVLLGDHFFRESAQEPLGSFGSVLRLVPARDEDASGHSPAAGNAADGSSVYARGLRSPWRGTRDSKGRFFVGDVGEYGREEVNLVSRAGQNFGWPVHEGPCPADCEPFAQPLTSYGRSSDERYVLEDPQAERGTGRSVWVGDIYEAPRLDRYHGLLDGRVPFGEFYTGWVRVLAVDDAGALSVDRHVGHLPRVTAWHTGPDGYMYALTLGGALHRARQVLPR